MTEHELHFWECRAELVRLAEVVYDCAIDEHRTAILDRTRDQAREIVEEVPQLHSMARLLGFDV